MLWFKKKCEHEYENIGTFYKEIFTEYTNCFDRIDVYRRNRCKICGHIEDTLLSSEEFMPELYEGRDERKDEYIKHLRIRDINWKSTFRTTLLLVNLERKFLMNKQKEEFKTINDVPKSWLDRCSDNGYPRYTDDDGNRRYVDNNKKTGDMPFRPCAKCGRYPNENGDDFCIQNLGRVVNACCGHGTHEGYIMFDDGRVIRGWFTVENLNKDSKKEN